jgi:hypothetical protein
MIKFNHFVRASVLSLTLAGGLALAGHAFAYDAADLSDAEAAVSTAQTQADYDQDQMDALAAQQADADAYYNSAPSFCPYWSEGYSQCMYDVEDWWRATTQSINDQTAVLYFQLLDTDQPALDAAIAWRDEVADDQNGQHGVP